MSCCSKCLAWEYQNTDFSQPDGRKMAGWCRVWNQVMNQKDGCNKFSSRAKQEKNYLGKVTR